MDETQNGGEPKDLNNMGQNPVPTEETKEKSEEEVPTTPATPEAPAEEVPQA